MLVSGDTSRMGSEVMSSRTVCTNTLLPFSSISTARAGTRESVLSSYR